MAKRLSDPAGVGGPLLHSTLANTVAPSGARAAGMDDRAMEGLLRQVLLDMDERAATA